MATKLTRREFLLATGAATTTAVLTNFGFDLSNVVYATSLRIVDAKENLTVCCFCSVGCGAIVHTQNNKMINLEGDPDNPISEGALCSKGQAMFQMAYNKQRVERVKYRAAGASDWQTKDWDWAMKEIAKRVKATRDASFKEKDEAGITVNRTEAIAQLGGAAHDNEECYLLSKLGRALGIVYLEHQARI
ncbi:MAG: hypothetical protein ABH838_04730 [Actinomycetota bacterium]